MKKRIILFLAVLSSLFSCTKQTVIDTGTNSGVFDMSMMDYLRTDPYNWGYTVKAIELTGLTDMFEKETITFLGIKSFTIENWVYANRLDSLEDADLVELKEMILDYVIEGNIKKEDVEYRDMDYSIQSDDQTGGSDFETMGGRTVRLYLEKSPWEGVPDAGPITFNAYSMSYYVQLQMATPGLTTNNGTVHALNSTHKFGEI